MKIYKSKGKNQKHEPHGLFRKNMIINVNDTVHNCEMFFSKMDKLFEIVNEKEFIESIEYLMKESVSILNYMKETEVLNGKFDPGDENLFTFEATHRI